MEDEVAAFVFDVAPGKKRGEWNQKGFRRVLYHWEEMRPRDFQTINFSRDFAMVVGLQIMPSGQGQYGYDTGLHFEPDIEEHLLDDVEGGELAHEFYDDWVGFIQNLIEEEQEQTAFSPKEYATLFGHRHPFRPEAKNADGLGITIGTYRGKVGRVKSKLEEARKTVGLVDSIPDSEDKKWSGPGHSAHPSVIYRVDEDDLPLNSVHSVDVDGITLDEMPLDKIILD